MGIMAIKALIKFIIARWGPAYKILFLLAGYFMRPRGDLICISADTNKILSCDKLYCRCDHVTKFW